MRFILTIIFSLLFLTLTLNAQIIYIKSGASGDGSSWNSASGDLVTKMNNATTGIEIWVAEGTYSPGNLNNDRFNLKDGVKLYGGFPDSGNPTFLDRDVDAFPSVLDGGNVNNHVVYCDKVSNATLIDGFTIQKGAASGNALERIGAGLYNNALGTGNESSPVINNCTFKQNIATGNGGAIMNIAINGGIGNPVISNCHFMNNQANDGGAIYNWTSNGGEVSPMISNSQFEGNTANGSGGAIHNNSTSGTSNPQISDCYFYSNISTFFGGAIYCSSSSGVCSPLFNRCQFLDNLSSASGGGIYFNVGIAGSLSEPSVDNCLFSFNTADNSGGAIGLPSSAGIANMIIKNSTFVTNSATNGLGQSVHIGSPLSGGMYSADIDNCLVWNTFSVNGTSSIHAQSTGTTTIDNSLIPENDCSGFGLSTTTCQNVIFNQNPLFVNEGTLNFRLKPCSPAVNTGNNHNVSTLDFDQNIRTIYTTTDIGAFEMDLEQFSTLKTVNTPNNSVSADSEFTDSNGWTHYYDCDGEILTFSIQKNGENIGTLTSGLIVEQHTSGGYNSGTALDLSNADYVNNTTNTWFVTNRSWQVSATNQPNNPVSIRFYYEDNDFSDLAGSTNITTEEEMYFYKVLGTDAYATNVSQNAFNQYTKANQASLTEWTKGSYNGLNYAEFQVNEFSAGSMGSQNGGGVALPLELLNFDITLDEKNNTQVAWETINEVNIHQFELQKSSTGNDFSTLFTTSSKGGKDIVSTYHYLDEEERYFNNYYRLKIIDKDGQFSFSDIRMIILERSSDIKIYPNPMSNQLIISSSNPKEYIQSWSLFSLQGTMLFQQENLNANKIVLQEFPVINGQYVLQIITEKGYFFKRLNIHR